VFYPRLFELLKLVGGKNVSDDKILFEVKLLKLLAEIVLDDVVVVAYQTLDERSVFLRLQLGILQIIVQRIYDHLLLEFLEGSQPAANFLLV
jgi:hypothetical protein